jgi:hypothetical protein
MELPGYQYLWGGGMHVMPDGTLSVSDGTVWVHRDGTIESATLSGTLSNGHMTGSTSAGSFDLTVTDLQSQPLDMTTKAGVYLSTENSANQIAILEIHADGSMVGTAYATLDDAHAALSAGYDFRKYKYGAPIGVFQSTWTYSDSSATHKNAINFGMWYSPINADGTRSWNNPSSYGFAYFDSNGDLVALTANPVNAKGGQWSGVLVYQAALAQ